MEEMHPLVFTIIETEYSGNVYFQHSMALEYPESIMRKDAERFSPIAFFTNKTLLIDSSISRGKFAFG